MTQPPQDSNALVTGASSGIGREIARLLARDGVRLVLSARSETALNELAKELIEKHHVDVRVIPADLSEPDGARELASHLSTHKIVVHTLVNNAGFGTHGEFATSDPQLQDKMINVNVAAVTHLARAVLPQMVAMKSGRILNVASTAAFQPGPLMAVYYATKAYVLSFSEALSVELKGTGVTVTALCPGPTLTDFQRRAKMENSALFSANTMSAGDVARIGYDAMKRGKRTVIAGAKNKLFVSAVPFLPRGMVLAVAKRLNSTREST
jgi:short-subunit dehydrogenase